MFFYKSISAVLCSALLLNSVFFQSTVAERNALGSVPERSNLDTVETEYSHFLSDERYKYFFDSKDEIDPAAEAAIESELKEKQLKECADAILSNSKIADYIDIQDFYSTKPQFRLESDETLSTYVFQNADGTNTTYYLAENVKYVSEDGVIHEKDIHLKQNKDGYYVNDSDVKIHISQSPLDGVILDTVLGTIRTRVGTFKNDNRSSLTIFSKEDNSVTYSDIFGAGLNLRIVPLLSGIEEDIIINKKTDRNSFSLAFCTNNLVGFQNDDNICLRSGDSNNVLSFEQVYIYDAKGLFYPVEALLDPLDAKGSYLFTVSLPDAFINNPDVVYPVTVSSKIQVRSGLDNIIDASVYQNIPNMNAGSWSYNNIGYTDSTYGLARTLIKLEGMLNSSIYQNLSAGNITSVYFNAREATGNSYKQVKIHPITGTPTWTESTVTWNNYGSFDTGVDYGGSIGYDEWASFDITNLVKAWKNNSYNNNGCFIFIMGGTENSTSRSLYSSEFSTSTYRPYVQMTYQNPYFFLMYTDITIEKGETLSEVAGVNPSTGTIVWDIDMSAVASATVSQITSSVCYISGLQPGKAVLTAKLYYGTVLMTSAYCNVTVILPQGVYYIRNSNYVGIRTNGTINNNANLYQWNTGNVIMPEYVKVQYLWKIKYLGSDRYSIRSMMKSDMGIAAGNANSVILSELGTLDDLSLMGSSQKWGITWNSTAGGVIIYKDSSTSQVIQGQNNSLQSGVALVTGEITSQSSWVFELEANPPEGVSFYKISDGTYYLDPVLFMVKGQIKTLQELGIKPAVYRTDTNAQTVFLSVDTQYSQFVDISSMDNEISAEKPGIAVITAESISNSPEYGYFTVDVAPFRNGYYYIQNIDSDRFMYANTIYNGAGLITENFNNQAQWMLEYQGDSYYTVKWSNNQNYYAGVENDSNSNNANVVLRSGNVTDGMKWKYEENEEHHFWTITPKCAASVSLRMKEASFSNIKISNSTGESSKWMIWNAGDFFTAWTPTYWYSDVNDVGYWNKPQEDSLLIHKTINYEGLDHDFDDAFDFAKDEWEQALGISITVVSSEFDCEMRYFVDTTETIYNEFQSIADYLDDGDVLGMAPISEKSLIGHCYIGQNRIISVYNITKSDILLKTDSSMIYYSENPLAAHEMGHALGFLGHIPASYISDSVMSQGQYGYISGLTSYDINHLLQIYNAFV